MHAQLIRLRIDGVLVPKYEIKHQPTLNGDLRIFDEREGGYNRILKIAEFRSSIGIISRLWDAEIVWMNDDRFTIKGFEQKSTERGLVDYAQSWLINIAVDAPTSEPPAYNKRR